MSGRRVAERPTCLRARRHIVATRRFHRLHLDIVEARRTARQSSAGSSRMRLVDTCALSVWRDAGRMLRARTYCDSCGVRKCHLDAQCAVLVSSLKGRTANDMILPEPTPQFVAHRPPRSPSPRTGDRRRQASPCRLEPVRGSRRTSAASTASVEADDDDSCSDCSVASVTGGGRGRAGVVFELAVEDAFRNPWHWSVAPVPVRPRLPPATPPPRPIRRARTVQDRAWVAPAAPPWWWPPSPQTYRVSIGEAGEDDPGFYLRSVDPAQSKLRAATLAREKNGCVLASLPHTRRADVARAPRSPHFSKYAQPTNRPISTRGAWTPPAARLQMLFHAALDDNFLFMVPKDCGSRRIVRPSLLIRVGSR
ncbi:hypothetical protein HPB51_024911 [Rhipicephalus microplus]|uniref:Uncharacterized protein n=1 Tax=Rhipicephalus microplus TaxID=6941 RepID=A0A9J6DXS0_RHIMP|nr:hypothetical protein HPB51_024911 [Rhipicephalus microplus]